jgi:3',5'-nucleoside bisphosphate phosphatase
LLNINLLSQSGGHIKADLHTHTYYSDGRFSPAALVELAKRSGLNIISVTDHDNVDGIDEAAEAGKNLGIEVIPGVELSSEHKGREVHVLGYFVDRKSQNLLEHLNSFRQLRKKRAEKIVEKLNTLNVPLTMNKVLEQVRGNASIGRPHVAYAMVENKLISNYYEAFSKYLGDYKPAYEKKPNISTQEAIKLISDAGGLSFIAHPGKTVREDILIEIIEFGIDGVEVIHPSHTAEDVRYFRGIASQYFLLESGGSDFHGGRINDDSLLGAYWVNEQKVQAMKNRLFN